MLFKSLHFLQKRYVGLASDAFTLPHSTRAAVFGWVRSFRPQKKNTFIHLTDGLSSRTLQLVISTKSVPSTLSIGCSVKATGLFVESIGPRQPVELLCDSIEVLGPCSDEEFPFMAKKRFSQIYTRGFQQVRSKTFSFASMLRIRSRLITIIHDYFDKNGFLQIHTPVITGNDCEGAGEAFCVTKQVRSGDKVAESIPGPEDATDVLDDTPEGAEYFFGKPAYLTVSAQLHLEAAASGIAKVYTFSPAFRTEFSSTRCRLSEFYMVEAEMAFVTDLFKLTDLAENIVKHCAAHLLESSADDIRVCLGYHFDDNSDLIAKQLEKLETLASKSKFTQISYSEAIEILLKSSDKFKVQPIAGKNFVREHEQFLVDHFGGLPVFVLNYPSDVKPFYMKRSAQDPKFAECFDLLTDCSGEICGGGLREDDYGTMQKRMEEENVTKSLDWYLSLRKCGNAPHGGFGIGFDRLLQSFLGIANIRDTALFPRKIKQMVA